MGGNPQRPMIVLASEQSIPTIAVIRDVGMAYTKGTCGGTKGAVIGLDLRLGPTPRKCGRECNSDVQQS